MARPRPVLLASIAGQYRAGQNRAGLQGKLGNSAPQRFAAAELSFISSLRSPALVILLARSTAARQHLRSAARKREFALLQCEDD
jgi:hypothetical protein